MSSSTILRAYKRTHYQKHAVYETVKANYLATKKPVVLLGHSLGANALMYIEHMLKTDNIPVAAIFAYDPTPIHLCVPDNVIAAIGWRRTYPGLGGGVIRKCDQRVWPTGSPVQKTDLETYDVTRWAHLCRRRSAGACAYEEAYR